MERAVIHSDLKKQEISPRTLIGEYLVLLKKDIKRMLVAGSLSDVSCPVDGEKEVIESFCKMGMQYQVSKTFRNIYLSPRPSMKMLKSFYRKSNARKFWLTELWPQTHDIRQDKIILPLLEWSNVFISQYIDERKMLIAEFLPNYWGYFLGAKIVWPETKYQLIDPLFDLAITSEEVSTSDINYGTTNNTYDVVMLFEALDRTVEPASIFNKVKNMLKPGGLCFITCLLSSGFEVLVMGQDSGIFLPPERMNFLSYEGMNGLIDKVGGFEILEFSTPSVLDVQNVIENIDQLNNSFVNYILKERNDDELILSFQDFLQKNCLGSFGRIVVRKIDS